jgi:parvulin-like peptidyl-prolyl isomerase
VSPDQGRKGKPGKGGSGGAAGPVAARRALLAFGVVFVALFLIVAISEGVGDPSVPSGDAILVENTPGDVGDVSVADVEHAIEIAAAGQGIKKAPKPGDPKYEETKEEAEQLLLEGIWIQGVADEWGIEVTDAEVAKERKKIKKESFKSETEFKEFLKESHYTSADIDDRVRVQVLSEKLQEELKEKAPKPTQSEIENYYEAAKAAQFTQAPSLDVRLILNKSKKKAEAAFAALSKDNSAKNWTKTAKTYSEDPTTKSSGGLRKAVQEGTLEEPLDAEVFAAAEGRLEGPTKVPAGYYVFEVVNSTPETVQELKTVESQIESTLAQQLEQEYFTNFISQFSTEWTERTFCADGYVVERCANYQSSGHPTTAPEGCYEADPKGGRPEACPASVFQAAPALPGSITPLEPNGKPLSQRPRPAGEEKEAAAEGEGLPEGAVPPTGEAAPEEAPPEEAPPEEPPPEESSE